MPNLHPTNLQSTSYAISRHAAERFAVLTAVKEQRAARRRVTWARRRTTGAQPLVDAPAQQPLSQAELGTIA